MVGKFVESVESMDTFILETINKLKEFVNQQLKNQTLITNYFSIVYCK